MKTYKMICQVLKTASIANCVESALEERFDKLLKAFINSSLYATCTSSLTGYVGTTTKIEVTQTLQVKNGAVWRKCESWDATYYNYYCTFTNSRSVYSGNQYRVKSEFKVYSGSNYETITDYSDPVWT